MFEPSHFRGMPRLRGKKSRWIGFLMGLLFGCIGLAIYFRTFSDFLIPFLFIVFIAGPTSGLGAPAALVLCGLYGYFRAANSNERNGY